MTIRAATRADIPRLEEIERECFGHVASVAGELDRDWARVIVRDRSEQGVVAYLVAWNIADEVEVIHVATGLAARRAGHGRALMEHQLADARAAGLVRCLLEVRPGNTPALRLYQSLGFTELSRRRGYYDDGEDALVMELCLAP